MSPKSLILGLLLLGGFFGLLEGFWPSVRQPGWFRRRGSATDLVYWLFTPFVTRTLTRASLIVVIVLVALRAHVPLDSAHIEAALVARSGRPVTLPQVLTVLLAGDLIGYLVHRLFHVGPLWPFHAVHHSSTDLDWLSSVRLHPVNDILARLLQVVPLLLLGFDPRVLAAYLPFLTFHAIFIHSNLPWDFGPLRYLVSSPEFHRWHHTSQEEGLDRNFAGLFPFIDLAFRTFHMPRGRHPEIFGILGEQVPQGLFAQLAYPFRRAPERN